MKFLPMILRNLMRSRRRLILTVASMAISIFLFATLMSLPSVLKQIMRDQVSDLRMVCANKAGYLYMLPEAYGKTIASVPHVQASSGYIATVAQYRDPKDLIAVAALDPASLPTLRPEWGVSPGSASMLTQTLEGGVVSTRLAARYHWKVGDTITLRPQMLLFGDLPIQIVGIAETGPIELVLVPLERLDKLTIFKDSVFAYLIKVDRSENASVVAHEIDERFANSPFETFTQTEAGAAELKFGQLRLVFAGVRSIAAIIVVVIVMVAANTAAMTVRERRYELAVMRSIGYTPRTLATLLTAEGLAMGVIAGVIGCVAAYLTLRMPAHLGGQFGLLLRLVSLTPSVAFESVAIGAAIGLVSVAIPVLQAMRRSVVDTMRAVA